MRAGSIGGLIVLLWLILGGVAAYERGYFKDTGDTSCAEAGTVVVTVVAGPLNWITLRLVLLVGSRRQPLWRSTCSQRNPTTSPAQLQRSRKGKAQSRSLPGAYLDQSGRKISALCSVESLAI